MEQLTDLKAILHSEETVGFQNDLLRKSGDSHHFQTSALNSYGYSPCMLDKPDPSLLPLAAPVKAQQVAMGANLLLGKIPDDEEGWAMRS